MDKLSNDEKIKLFNEVFPVGSEALFPINANGLRVIASAATLCAIDTVRCQPSNSFGWYDVSKVKSPNHGDCPCSFGDVVEVSFHDDVESVFLRVDGDNPKVAFIAIDGNLWRVSLSHIKPVEQSKPQQGTKVATSIDSSIADDSKKLGNLMSYSEVMSYPTEEVKLPCAASKKAEVHQDRTDSHLYDEAVAINGEIDRFNVNYPVNYGVYYHVAMGGRRDVVVNSKARVYSEGGLYTLLVDILDVGEKKTVECRYIYPLEPYFNPKPETKNLKVMECDKFNSEFKVGMYAYLTKLNSWVEVRGKAFINNNVVYSDLGWAGDCANIESLDLSKGALTKEQVLAVRFNAKFNVGELIMLDVGECAIEYHVQGRAFIIDGTAVVDLGTFAGEVAKISKPKSPAQILVDEFNADYPVGSPVKVKCPADDYAALTGRKGAFIDSGGVVQVQITIAEGNLIVFPRNLYRPDLTTTYK